MSAAPAAAQEPEPSPTATPQRIEYAPRRRQPILVSWPRYAGEFEPFIFANGGYGLSLCWRPKSAPHWRLRGGGTAFHMPSWMVDMKSANRGWDVWIRGFTASAEWFPSNSRGGAFAGAGIGYSRNAYTPPSENGRTWLAHLVAVPVAGYQYFPLVESNLYLQLSVLANVYLLTDGVTTVNEEHYDEDPVVPSATFHIGIEF